MAEFTISSQFLQKDDPNLGQAVEELRTLQVKRSSAAVNQIAVRAKWERFGKGKVTGITETSREEIRIEPASLLWGNEEDEKAAQRLVSATGKMTVNTTKYVPAASTTPGATPGHSRRNSGASTPVPPVVAGAMAVEGTRSRNGSTNSNGAPGDGNSLPPAPDAS